MTIEFSVDELLERCGRTFYRLAKQTGISHMTLWRLKKGRALGVNFATLESICLALGCQPGEVLRLAGAGKMGTKRGTRGRRGGGKSSSKV